MILRKIINNSSQIQIISDNVDLIKIKTDNLPDDTIAEITIIKDQLNNVEEKIDTLSGGYLLN
jgi:hypothetical protein